MLEDTDYGVALLAIIIAWVILIYVVITYRSRSWSDASGFSPPRDSRESGHPGTKRTILRPLDSRFRGNDEAGMKQLSLKSDSPGAAPDLKDVGHQLHAVMAASFQKRRLLSLPEYQTFKIIEDDMATTRSGYRVFAQTSLGEVLTSSDEDAFRSINSKRVDILIVDRGGWPVLAVEYQGSGHYQGTAAARDAIKKEALRKAGVRYIEVFETDNAEQIRTRVRERLGWNIAERA